MGLPIDPRATFDFALSCATTGFAYPSDQVPSFITDLALLFACLLLRSILDREVKLVASFAIAQMTALCWAFGLVLCLAPAI